MHVENLTKDKNITVLKKKLKIFSNCKLKFSGIVDRALFRSDNLAGQIVLLPRPAAAEMSSDNDFTTRSISPDTPNVYSTTA